MTSPRTIVKRKAKRLGINVSVKWSIDDHTRSHKAEAMLLRTRNLTQKGLYLKCDYILSVGHTVHLEIMLQRDEPPVEIDGKVAWVADPKRHPAYYPGMGIQFVTMSAKTRSRINAFIKERAQRFKDAQELKKIYLRLKEMAASLVEIEEKHPKATKFRTAINHAIREMEDVAHMIDREVREVRDL